MTQKDALKKWFKTHKTITARQAVEQLGIMCLHKRIAELEDSGCKFIRPRKKVASRYEHCHPITIYTAQLIK